MTDNELGSSPRLRDLLNLDSNGRRIHHWSGQDRDKDINELTRAIAAAVSGLGNDKGRIVQLDRGDLRPINQAAFRGLVDRHICRRRIVNRGAGYEEEFFTYQFPPTRRFDHSISGPQPAPDESTPDDKVFDQIFRTELLKRLPRVE
jgi:hypothetical protein